MSCYYPRIIVPSLVLSSATFPVQIAMGDSLEYGNDHPELSWRMVLSTLSGKTSHAACANGRTIEQMITAYDSEARPWMPATTGVPAISLIQIGNNDFFTDTADQAFAELTTLIQNSRNYGCYVGLVGVTPATSQPPGSQWDNRRIAYTGYEQEAVASGAADFFFDTASLLPDPANQTYYESDGTHYTAAGNTLIANAIYAALKSHFNWP